MLSLDQKELLQEIFDTSYRGMSRQKWVHSTNQIGQCVYRGLKGMKCGIGHVIANEFYFTGLECMNVGHDKVKTSIAWSLNKVIDDITAIVFQLKDLQQCHDGTYTSYFPVEVRGESMKGLFEEFAKVHDLMIPYIDE